ncbi:hypothetical protein [Bradyrhizobium sp. S3.3.6]
MPCGSRVNGISYNIARSVGPAVGGMLVGAVARVRA